MTERSGFAANIAKLPELDQIARPWGGSAKAPQHVEIS
jgi:hypothetical protein